MPTLSSTARARLPDSSFAYVDSQGRRRLPINDISHVRNALARFDQVDFEDDAAREKARERLLRAAKKHGIVPLGFFDGQLRKASGANVRSLPRGTLTFLLTDIEGSTRLLERLGDGYTGLLRDVRTAIRTSVRAASGYEVDARADEFFAVFRRSTHALEAALAIQRALRDRTWPQKADVRVRIGMHTGRPTLTDTGYVGIAVHIAARVAYASHGGQILLSSAARESFAERLAEGVSFRNLGRFSLHGVAEPEALFQVDAAGLITKFPRPRTIGPLRSRTAREGP
jgi:class 3 adenylate cyclase